MHTRRELESIRHLRISFSQLLVNAVICLLIVMTIYPITIMLFGFSKDPQTWDYNKWAPALPLWFDNLGYAWKNISTGFVNTVYVALIVTIGGLFLSSISGFVFARMKFPGREFLFMCIISLMMVPSVLTLTPWFLLMRDLGFINSVTGLALSAMAGAPIFGTFLLRSFFNGIPEELFEAARIDGYSDFGLYLKICLPLSLPILGTLAIMYVVAIWNDVVQPSILLTSPAKYTLTLSLLSFQTQSQSATVIDYPSLFSAYIIAALPLLLLFIFASKYYIEGLTSAGLKF